MKFISAKMKKMGKRIITMAVAVLLPSLAEAQDQDNIFDQEFLAISILTVMGLTIIVLITAIYSLHSLKRAITAEGVKKRVAQGEEVVVEPSWWSRLVGYLTRSVPVENEEEILLDHNYDGIRELDNHLPPWWKYLFYITIIFGIVYLLGYYVFDSWPLSTEEYNNEMAVAEEEAEARRVTLEEEGVDESALAFSEDPADLANGKNVYDMQCAVCHRDDGGGGIGPNLTDKYWIHGGTMTDISNIIKVGVLDKGMISWEAILSPVQIRDVTSYIISLQGTARPDAKEAQGELFEGAPQ